MGNHLVEGSALATAIIKIVGIAVLAIAGLVAAALSGTRVVPNTGSDSPPVLGLLASAALCVVAYKGSTRRFSSPRSSRSGCATGAQRAETPAASPNVGGMSMSAALRTAQRSSLLQVAKSAIATVLAWFLAGWLIPGPPPVFAAIAALLVVQPSLNQSFGKALERSVGVIVGVLVASALGLLLGDSVWVVAAAVGIALVLAWALRMTPGTGNQVAVSALLVLALGAATPDYALDRVLETLIGAVIGFAINVLVVPPLSVEPAQRAVRALADELADALDRLAGALGERHSPAQLDALLQQARGMRTSRDAAAAAIASARDSLTLNPRAPRHRAELAVLERSVATLTPIVTQAVGMTRAFHERYDESLRSEPAIAAIAEQLSRAAHDVRFAPGRDAATAPDSAGLEPAALTRPLALVTPSSDHWILVGSMMVDLLRIHHSLVEEN
ncbi:MULTISPECIES: aromatic acid exporter family protein [unclassified Microbacterium]|uniref:FUSC family protein n=1 Tax=unclassified Microbacterium TaxID=2609290 RepID=UPI0025D94802|nr:MULTISPECIES: FUSC family protein [unclassified Microbacterium]